jgi:tetratricopeptide (TPR) repeat protein
MSFAKHAPPEWDRPKKTLGPHPPERRSSGTHGGRVVTGIVSVFLAVIVWIAFGQAVRHEFVGYDDQSYVARNPRVTNGLTLDGIQWAFTHVHVTNWHPLTMISHMLDCQLYGLQPWGHHLTNILLQAAAAILLFLALRNLTGDPWPSLFVAAVFAVHPLRVESVAWVSERKDLLSGVFFMLVLWAYARYARGNARSSFWYLTVAVLFALGLMCKPTLVTLPFVLLLLDYWPLGRVRPSSSRDRVLTASKWQQRRDTWPRLVIEKLPLFVLSAASCVATLLAQKEALDASLKPPLGERVGNAVISYAGYIGQMIWPAHLAVLYPYPEGHLEVPHVILALLLLLMISVAFFLWRKKYPFLLIGWLWYLGMLFPMIGIIQVGSQVRADRYTYLPQIGLSLLVGWGGMELFHRWRRTREILAITAVLIIMALSMRSYLQTSYWRDTETLWKHAIATTSNNYIAHVNLAHALSQTGRFDEAIAECREALKIKPDFAAAHNNLGDALTQSKPGGGTVPGQNALDEAIGHFRAALQIKPDFMQARSNLGNVLLQNGQMDEAIAQFQKILEMDPHIAEAEFSLGKAFLQKREVNEAIAHYQKALEIDPDYAEAQYYLGNAFIAEGKYSEAIANYEAAVRTRPDFFEAHHNMGCVLATIGNTDKALEQFNEALRLNGNDPQAHFALGSLLARLGRREEAIAHLAEALRLKPDYEYAKQQLRELGVPVQQ